MTLTVRVDELMRPSASLFDYFVLDTSRLDGVSPLSPAESTVDISSDVRTIRTTRGKYRELDEYGTGALSCELNNQSRRYDPTNTASIYYGNIAPMRSVFVTAVLNGVDYPLFRGYSERWRVDYSQQNLPLASIDALDAFLLLSRAEMTSVAAAYTGDLAGARVARVLNLDEVSFPTDIRAIDTGLTTMGDTTLGENALSYLQKIARSEGGAVFVSNAGVLTFVQRNTPPGASMATFSDDGAGSSIKYLTIDQDTGTDLLYNRVVTSGTSASRQVAEDAISQADNRMTATLDRTGQLARDDADMLDQAKWLVARYATAETRLRQVTVAMQSLTAARQAELLALELGDRVTVKRTPPGGGSPATISQAAIVIGISHEISDAARTWFTTVTFSAGKRAIGFVLDDVDLGQLDDDFLAY